MTLRLSELSIRNRFALPVAGMLLVLGALVLIVFPSRLQQVTEQDLQSKGLSIAKIIGHSSAAALEFGDDATVRQFLESARLDEDVTDLVVFDSDGKEFASVTGAGSGRVSFTPTTEFVAVVHENDRIEASGPIDRNNRTLGYVMVGVSSERLRARNQTDFVRALIVTMLVGFGGIYAVFIVARQIASPLEELTKTAERIATEDMTALAGETKRMASGDLTGHVLIPSRQIELDSGGEIGRMSRAFNLMLAKLAEVAEATNLVSAGLRNIVIHVQSSAEEVASGSDAIANATGDAARRNESTVGAVEEISATLHEMNVNIQNVARNAQSQAASTTHTLGSVEDLLQSVETVAATVRDLMSLTQQAGKAVTEGDAAMEHASKGMNEIRDVIGTSAEHVQVLGNMAGDIGSIVAVIDEIAEQSNLLALNAAIEAARAGEHGVGFAVVAEEVRKLSERSTRSTGEIAELVKRIQAQVRDAVDNMGKSTSIVDAGMGRTDELRNNLARIEEVVSEVARCSQDIGAATGAQSKGTQEIEQATSQLRTLTREISAATEEQSTGTQQVVRAIKDIGDMVQGNADNASDLAASSHELSRQVSLMREVAGKFHVDTEPSGPSASSREEALIGGGGVKSLGAEREGRRSPNEHTQHAKGTEAVLSGATPGANGSQ